MKGKIKKALSIFLAMCAISTVFQLSSYSVDADSAPAASGGGTASESSYVMEMTEDGEKLRLTEEEPNLRTKIYLNRDGTKSMEVYDDPVKYVASDGLIKDKLLTIEATAGGFISAQSDIECRFSADISRGIGIRRGAFAVMMLPDDAVDGTAVLSTDGKEVTYLVDDSTVYRYSLTYTGYKEEIIVSEYTGQTKYVFRYLTDGLSLEQTGDCYGFVDGNGEVKATLSEILIFTADDRNNRVGDMSVETVRANEEYVVTLELDENYLSDPLTAYPLIIDPSIDITYENSGADAIEDATINSAAGTSGSGTTLNVGLRSSYGIARILVKFPGLDLSPIASADNIVSARFRVRDLMCYSTHLPVNCHVFKSAWTENTVNWSSTNPNNYNSQVLDTLTVYYNNGNHVGEGYTHSNIYEFNVLQAVKGWKSGTYNQNAGIMLKTTAAIENGSNNISVVFASYERNTNKPKLFVTYTEPVDAQLNSSSIVIDEGGSYQLQVISSNAQSVIWGVVGTSLVSITQNGLVTGLKAGTTSVYANVRTAEGASKLYYCTVTVKIPDGIYYINNVNSGQYITASGKITENQSLSMGGKFGAVPAAQKAKQQWKINYLDSGHYTIRPLYKADMAIVGNGTTVKTSTIGASSLSAGADGTWTIVWQGTGYCLYHKNNLSEALVQNGSVLTTASMTSSDTFRWSFSEMEYSYYAVKLYDTVSGDFASDFTRSIVVGKSRTLSDMNYRIAVVAGIESNYQSVYWSSSDTSVATVNSSTGEVTAKSEGTVTITAKRYLDGNYYTAEYSLVVVPFPSGPCVIKNRKMYTNIGVAGVRIVQANSFGADYYNWTLELQESGYYYIKLTDTSNLLAIPNGGKDSSSTILSYEQLSSSGIVRQQWKITLTSHNSFVIKSRYADQNQLNLCIICDDSGQILQSTYVNDTNYKDEWFVVGKTSYLFGLSVQNAYASGCEMYKDGTGNYSTFGIYADNVVSGLQGIMNKKFDYRGANSWANDFKNKNAPGSVHAYVNMDDVDLMFYVGHGVAKNRNKGDGLFQNNALHFGTTNSSTPHAQGVGTGDSSNFTTQDALYFGYQTRTKWLLTYTCNFLNTAQGDTNVQHMLDRGGRLIMGMSSTMYVVGSEGETFAKYLTDGYTFEESFFGAARKSQSITSGMGIEYSILYYGEVNGGTLNDRLGVKLEDVENTGGKIKITTINSLFPITRS